MSVEILNIVQIIFLLVVLFGGLEILMRKKGVKPKPKGIYPIKIEPERCSFFIQDPELGYSMQEGNYKLTIKERFTFRARHDEYGNRITSNRRDNFDREENTPQVWIFGCSNTYGWLLNDEESFPWLIQEKLKDFKVVNFGVDGYSTLQSFLQFKKALKVRKTPVIVILGYCSFHDNRNTMSRSWLKKVDSANKRSPFSIPYARMDDEDKLLINQVMPRYTGFPFIQYSALLNGLDNRLNVYLDKSVKSREVTKKIISEFHQLCDEHGSEFIVASLNKSKGMLKYCQAQGMSTVDVSVGRGSENPEHTHYPYDTHPSALANKKFARKLIHYLQKQNTVKQF